MEKVKVFKVYDLMFELQDARKAVEKSQNITKDHKEGFLAALKYIEKAVHEKTSTHLVFDLEHLKRKNYIVQ